MCAFTQDRTGDLQIFSLTLSQLSYKGIEGVAARLDLAEVYSSSRPGPAAAGGGCWLSAKSPH